MKRLLSLTLCLALLLCGCGASKSASSVMNEMAYDSGVTAETWAAAEGGQITNSGDTVADLPENRKFIITVNLSAETDELDGAVEAVSRSLKDVGGYVESQNIYNGSAYSGRRYRDASITLRIPADKLDAFTQAVEGCTNVVSSSRSTEDVTLQYVDIQGRITALETEQSRLLELLSQAETMSDLLKIEERLTDVRADLESYTSQMRVLENQVDYATVYLDITEVKEYTPVEEKSRAQKIGEGFVKSLKDLGSGILDFVSWLLINIPYILVFGLLLFGAGKLVQLVRKKKRAKKQAQKKENET